MILPALTAAMRAASSISGPREVLIRNGALLHSRNVLGADDAAASRRQDHVNGDGVGISHELRFVDEAGAGVAGLGFGQIRTPGDHVHIERYGVARHARAQAPEPDDTKRFAGEPYAHRHATLEAAGSHGLVGDRDGAGGGDQQAKRQFGRRVGSACAAAAVLQTAIP